MTAGTITVAPATNNRRYVNSEINLTITIKSLSGTLTNATETLFKWKSKRTGAEQTVMLTNTATGIYTASFTPTREGTVYFRIKTTAPDAAYEGAIAVAESRFVD